eukprot:191829_1
MLFTTPLLPFGDFISTTPLLPLNNSWWVQTVKDLRYQTNFMPSYWNYNKTALKFSYDIIQSKILGGGLSANGQKWSRGSTRDFDYIAQKYNLSNWYFVNVLPYFNRLENYFGENKTLRSSHGPIHIIDRKIQKYQYALSEILNSSIKSGIQFNNNYNGGYSQNGIHFAESNIAMYTNGANGLFNTKYYRSSSAESYIRSIGINCGYLTVWSNTSDNTLSVIHCRKEVILSAGVRYI